VITLKSNSQIALMKEAGRIVAESLALLAKMVEPGITTQELDQAAEEYILKRDALPAFKGYKRVSGYDLRLH
jgi:methionyl aminopeptidase